ncbi:hypothetical protein EDC04DRAFT_2608992 [Pisolithus marmoratus]|nr:hypothetical protein EDC04DRAFT_2608992 [Pisolithus marmoratus]
MKWVKAVSMPSPDKIAWFSLASVDPPLVNCMLMRFSAQWWQDGDTGQVCYGEFAGKLARIITMDSQCKLVTVCVSTERSSDEVVEALEISVHDFKLEFPTGASIQVIMGLNCGFQGIVIGKVDDMYVLQGSDQQASHGLANMLHWYSSHKILITPSTLQQADPDNLGDKGKSKAEEPEVPSGDGDIDEGSDLIQVSVSMDEALIIPPSTLQFSRERGYDVTIGDCVRVVHGPAVDIEGLIRSVDFISGCLTVLSDDGLLHDVLISFCIKLENHSLHDMECQVGHEVWIISGPKKGIMQLKNTAVVTEFGMCLNGAILDSTQMVAFIELHWKSFVWTAPQSATPTMSTVDPSAEPGPSTLACDPGSPTLMILPLIPSTSWHKQTLTMGVFLGSSTIISVTMPTGMSYNCGLLLKQVVHTMVPDHFSTVVHGHGLAPPGHVSVTVTSSTVSANIEHHFIPAHDLTPTNPRSAGQYCLVLHGKLMGQIHQAKKCQVKKDLKGVELEDGTKLPLGDVCQVISAN